MGIRFWETLKVLQNKSQQVVLSKFFKLKCFFNSQIFNCNVSIIWYCYVLAVSELINCFKLSISFTDGHQPRIRAAAISWRLGQHAQHCIGAILDGQKLNCQISKVSKLSARRSDTRI